jgi:GxxExxY protein
MSADLDVARTNDALLHRALTERILRVFYEVYNELGGGFLESVYQAAFALALRQEGLTIEAEVPVPVFFRGVRVGDFRADMTVNRSVLLELKAVASLDRVHEGQILNYLRATTIEVGLLLNFGPKPQFRRLVWENGNKIRVDPRTSAVKEIEVRV